MQKGLIVHTLITNDKGEILILQRSKTDDVLPEYWDIPGGTLEDGEDPLVGAMREVKEETGIDIINPKLFFQKSNVDIKKNGKLGIDVTINKLIGKNITISPIVKIKFI